jgi:hypothetical protein
MIFKLSGYLNGVHRALVSYFLQITADTGTRLYMGNTVTLNLKDVGTGLLT